jgi:hypothetical protein
MKAEISSGLVFSIMIGDGAGTKIRTRDLLITNQLLYQLSYTGMEQARHFIGLKPRCEAPWHQDYSPHPWVSPFRFVASRLHSNSLPANWSNSGPIDYKSIALDNCSCIALPSPIHGLVPTELYRHGTGYAFYRIKAKMRSTEAPRLLAPSLGLALRIRRFATSFKFAPGELVKLGTY